uniref:immunoglobulin-like domain-containing protein n=1 Tax=Clostridium sp. NkU-1 TaxID=1095009 RepID=UPI0006CF5703
MTVESVVDTKITVCINYSADDPAIFGEDYILEVKDGQKWYPLPVKDNIMFTSMGYGLKKGSSFPWSTDFEILYGKLSAGQYRIIKGIRIEPQQETPKEYFISAEFSI